MGVKDDIERIIEQERVLVFPAFDENAAFRLGTWLHARAIERSLGIVIDIRAFDRPLFYAATAGSTFDNNRWAFRKSNIVKHFHKSSYRVGLEMQLKGTALEERGDLAIADYAAKGGAFPIHVRATGVIGSVAISGLPQREDHEMVVEALSAMLGLDAALLALGPEGQG